MTYHDLYIWLQQRRALRAETAYAQLRPGEPRDKRRHDLNTTVVRARPARGTSNLTPGVYRNLAGFHQQVAAHRRLVALCYSPTPRLVKTK